ncbi:MAG: hypothetical protein AAF585_29760, partial [Verrucomicrobiota bacterium]
MSNKTKVLIVSTPFLVLAAVVLFLPQIREAELEMNSLKSEISKSGNEITSTCYSYCIGRYGVTDIGALRLAFEDLQFPGEASSTVNLKSESSFGERKAAHATSAEGMSLAYDQSGDGDHRFKEEITPTGTQFQFGGMTFEIEDATLKFGAESFDMTIRKPLFIVSSPL